MRRNENEALKARTKESGIRKKRKGNHPRRRVMRPAKRHLAFHVTWAPRELARYKGAARTPPHVRRTQAWKSRVRLCIVLVVPVLALTMRARRLLILVDPSRGLPGRSSFDGIAILAFTSVPQMRAFIRVCWGAGKRRVRHSLVSVPVERG
ncbi:hypothetical protein FB451DRAFT_1168775 [Mycena latifolia]|nr:hypothetical protein FB451DRAFT_1168775 [Mycena latifolia]